MSSTSEDPPYIVEFPPSSDEEVAQPRDGPRRKRRPKTAEEGQFKRWIHKWKRKDRFKARFGQPSPGESHRQFYRRVADRPMPEPESEGEEDADKIACMVCMKTSGQLIRPCRCGQHASYHWECLADWISKNEDDCVTCGYQFQDPRITRSVRWSFSRYFTEIMWEDVGLLVVAIYTVVTVWFLYQSWSDTSRNGVFMRRIHWLQLAALWFMGFLICFGHLCGALRLILFQDRRPHVDLIDYPIRYRTSRIFFRRAVRVGDVGGEPIHEILPVHIGKYWDPGKAPVYLPAFPDDESANFQNPPEPQMQDPFHGIADAGPLEGFEPVDTDEAAKEEEEEEELDDDEYTSW